MPRMTASITSDSAEVDVASRDLEARRRAAKAALAAMGLTVTEWADRNGYKRKHVYKVLSGESKAHFGAGHEIAVKLGIKDVAHV